MNKSGTSVSVCWFCVTRWVFFIWADTIWLCISVRLALHLLVQSSNITILSWVKNTKQYNNKFIQYVQRYCSKYIQRCIYSFHFYTGVKPRSRYPRSQTDTFGWTVFFELLVLFGFVRFMSMERRLNSPIWCGNPLNAQTPYFTANWLKAGGSHLIHFGSYVLRIASWM